jgi:hypothetical protein
MSKVSGNAIQIGESTTATNNYVLETSTDGTLRIKQGNSGSAVDRVVINAAGQLIADGTGLTNVTPKDSSITTAKLDSSTVAKQIAKAWVNFNGTGIVSIRSSFNVSSITDNGVGDYTVHFIRPMIDVNYCPLAESTQSVNNSANDTIAMSTQSTTSTRVFTNHPTTASFVDSSLIHVLVFGN